MAKNPYTPPNPYETRGHKRKPMYKKLVDIIEGHVEKSHGKIDGFPLLIPISLDRLAGHQNENCKRYVNAVRQARDFMDLKAKLLRQGLSITLYNHDPQVTARVRKIEA